MIYSKIFELKGYKVYTTLLFFYSYFLKYFKILILQRIQNTAEKFIIWIFLGTNKFLKAQFKKSKKTIINKKIFIKI